MPRSAAHNEAASQASTAHFLAARYIQRYRRTSRWPPGVMPELSASGYHGYGRWKASIPLRGISQCRMPVRSGATGQPCRASPAAWPRLRVPRQGRALHIRSDGDQYRTSHSPVVEEPVHRRVARSHERSSLSGCEVRLTLTHNRTGLTQPLSPTAKSVR